MKLRRIVGCLLLSGIALSISVTDRARAASTPWTVWVDDDDDDGDGQPDRVASELDTSGLDERLRVAGGRLDLGGGTPALRRQQASHQQGLAAAFQAGSDPGPRRWTLVVQCRRRIPAGDGAPSLPRRGGEVDRAALRQRQPGAARGVGQRPGPRGLRGGRTRSHGRAAEADLAAQLLPDQA